MASHNPIEPELTEAERAMLVDPPRQLEFRGRTIRWLEAKTIILENPLNVSWQAKIVRRDASITVEAHATYSGLDRTNCYAWALRNDKASEKLAVRLASAINSGAAVKCLAVLSDTTKKTYAWTHTTLLGRTLNADLKRLGY